MNLKATLIHIPRPRSSCLHCQTEFPAGSEYCSVVLGDTLSSTQPKADALQRNDYCLPCWLLLRADNSPQAQGAFWKARVAVNKEPKPQAHKRIDLALELLRSINHAELSDEEIFFLALFLARQRQLLFRQEINKEGQPYQLFEVTDTEEIFAVKKIDLRKVDLQMLQSSLAKRLHAEH